MTQETLHGAPAAPELEVPVERPRTRAPASAWYGLAVLIVATLLAAVDGEVFLLTAEPLRKSLGLSDTDLGLLQGVGAALFAGAASLPIAWLADRIDRRIVLMASVLVWCSAVVAVGAARNFTEMFIAMAFLGIGMAGLGPIVFGLIPDLFPPRQRILANAVYSLVSTLGAALGLFIGGPLVASIDSLRPFLPAGLQAAEAWRLAFFVVASPAPIMMLLIASIRLRRRAVQAQQVQPEAAAAQASKMTLVEYFRSQRRTMLGLCGSMGLLSFGFGAIGKWMPIVAARTFGATPTDVGQGLGTVMVIGMLTAVVLVVPAARLIGRRVGVAAPLRVIELGLLVAVSLCALLPFVATTAQLFAVICVQVAAVSIGVMLLNTALQDISPPYLRSRVIAIAGIIVLCVSISGPLLVGVLSDALSASPRALLLAVTFVAAAGLGFAALLMRYSERAFVRTVTTFTPEPAIGAT